MATLVKPWIVTYRDRQGRRCKKGDPGAKPKRTRSRKWYAQGVPGWAKGRREPLAGDKEAARQELARLVRDAELDQAGAGDRFKAHRGTPIAKHLAAWRLTLEGKGNTADYVDLAVGRVRDLLSGCGVNVLADIEAERVNEWLAELRRDKPPTPLPAGVESIRPGEIAARLGVTLSSVWQTAKRLGLEAHGRGRARIYSRAAAERILDRAGRGASVQTANYYLGALKGFCRWLVRDRRIRQSPVEHLQGGNPKLDRRHDRRELSLDELLRLFEAARVSPSVFRGLTGTDRHYLYLAATATGFRAEELAVLTTDSFALESDPPTAFLPAAATKNRKAVTQPLRPDVANVLRVFIAGKPAGVAVWPGGWANDAAEMLRVDLAAAGVPYETAGPDGPLFADFHALRHTYASQVVRSGATVKQAQVLARHSKAELTIGRYSHTALPELGAAVARLPELTAARGPDVIDTVALTAEQFATLAALAVRGIVLGALLGEVGFDVQAGVQTGDGENRKI